MDISTESALDLKRALLASHEAEQHLRQAGETDGVIQAAAADYLDKRAAVQEAREKVESEYEADSGEAPHTDRAETVAAADSEGKTPEDRKAEKEQDKEDGKSDSEQETAKETGGEQETAKETGGEKEKPKDSGKKS